MTLDQVLAAPREFLELWRSRFPIVFSVLRTLIKMSELRVSQVLLKAFQIAAAVAILAVASPAATTVHHKKTRKSHTASVSGKSGHAAKHTVKSSSHSRSSGH